MDFALSDDQILLQDQVDRAVGELAPVERVAAYVRDGDRAFATENVWQGLCSIGVPGLLVPEASGGLGLGILDAALVAEIMGRHAVPGAFLGPVVAAPLAILRAGDAEQQAELLPRIAEGSLRIAVAVSEQLSGTRGDAGVRLVDGRLSGSTQMAVDIAGADLILTADHAGRLVLVRPDAPGVTRLALNVVDRTRDAACLEFSGARPEMILPGNALAAIGAALRVVLAADLLGAASRMIDMAVAYAKIRNQFGRPIGSFQAVKHLCADMAAELEPGRALVWYAAHAQDVGLPDAALTALYAKAYLGEAARLAARNATEVHGGIGITEELGLHIWLKRISFGTQLFGGPTRLREEAAILQGYLGTSVACGRAAAE